MLEINNITRPRPDLESIFRGDSRPLAIFASLQKSPLPSPALGGPLAPNYACFSYKQHERTPRHPLSLVLACPRTLTLYRPVHQHSHSAMPSSSPSDMHTASADGLDYSLAPDDRTRDAVHTIVSGRKSWKTLKGKGEAVWPPYLEAALVEGRFRHQRSTSTFIFSTVVSTLFVSSSLWSLLLSIVAHTHFPSRVVPALDRYRPETSRSTRSLSRFPNRNRFISDYIFHVTGKRRTAKQVGSRLQQLRDTCGGKRSQSSAPPTSPFRGP